MEVALTQSVALYLSKQQCSHVRTACSVALPLIVQGSSPANVLGRGAAAWDPCGVPPWNLLRNGRGKPAGVVTIAIARELVGARWEIATA